MTHDYAKKPKPVKKRKKPTTSKKKNTQVPGWVWLFTGVITGLFIAFLAYLADITPQKQPEQTEQASSKAEPEVDDNASETKFDFYTLLPEREVIVPIEPEENSQDPQEKIFYLLQTGSFKNSADADRQRASLLLLGLEANIDKVKGNNGDIWHRVQVGPFTSRSKLAKTRSTLVNKGINPLVLKRKKS
jgi:cell division protein FtsN